MFVETFLGKRYPINWIGESELDGSLRFEIDNSAGHYNLQEVFEVFYSPQHTRTLTRVYDGTTKDYIGYSWLKGIEMMESNTIVVRLWPAEKTKKA